MRTQDSGSMLPASELMSPEDVRNALLLAERQTEGQTNHHDFVTLHELARRCSGNIIEIGTWKGKSTIALARGIRDRAITERFGALVFAFDIYRGGSESWPGLVCFCEALNWWYLHGVSDRIVPLRRTVPKLVAGEDHKWQCGLVFVDGAHEYEPALHDLTFAVAVSNRFIAVHDYYVPDVRQACDTALEAAEWPIVQRVDSMAVFEKVEVDQKEDPSA